MRSAVWFLPAAMFALAAGAKAMNPDQVVIGITDRFSGLGLEAAQAIWACLVLGELTPLLVVLALGRSIAAASATLVVSGALVMIAWTNAAEDCACFGGIDTLEVVEFRISVLLAAMALGVGQLLDARTKGRRQ